MVENQMVELDHSQLEYDKRVLSSLRQIIHATDKYSRKLRTELQITVPQLLCLQTIIDSGEISASRISQIIHVSKSTMVGILDRLEEKKLILRERSKLDRRQVIIVATDKGRGLAENAPSPLQDRLSQRLQELPDTELDLIASGLEKIVELMADDVEISSAAPILETGELLKEL